MTNLYPHITKAFKTTTVEKKGNYPYPISPFAGVTQPLEPRLLAEVAEASKKEKIFSKANLIVTFESAGTQLATIVGQALGLPYLVARKKRFKLLHEIAFSVATNYDEKNFYIYGDVKNKKILIIDDVVASGTTLKNAAVALKKAGANVIAFFAVAGKINTVGKKYQDTLDGVDIPLITIVKIQVIDGKVVVS